MKRISDLWTRIKDNWKSITCSILSMTLLITDNIWCNIIGLGFGVLAIGFNLYATNMYWEEFD